MLAVDAGDVDRHGPGVTEATKPSPLLAALCGLLAPGAGLCYAGRWRLALGVAAAYLGAAVVVPLVVVERGLDASRLPDLIKAAALAVWVPALVFGVLAAVVAPPTPGRRPAWRHPWWLFGFVLVTHAGASLAARQVRARVVTVVAVTQQLPRLQLDPPAAFVVVRRGFDPSTLAPGELVVVTREGTEQLARVESVDGVQLALDLGAGPLLQAAREQVIGRAVPARR